MFTNGMTYNTCYHQSAYTLKKLSNAINKSMGITGVQKLTAGVPHKRHLNQAKRQSNFYVNIKKFF